MYQRSCSLRRNASARNCFKPVQMSDRLHTGAAPAGRLETPLFLLGQMLLICQHLFPGVRKREWCACRGCNGQVSYPIDCDANARFHPRRFDRCNIPSAASLRSAMLFLQYSAHKGGKSYAALR